MKNMKIMAVLAILLTAALFVGAASASYTVNTYADKQGTTPNQGFIAGNPIYVKVVNDSNPNDVTDVGVQIMNGTTTVGSSVSGKVGQLITIPATNSNSIDLDLSTTVNATITPSTQIVNRSVVIVNSSAGATVFNVVGTPAKAVTRTGASTGSVYLNPVNGTSFGFTATVFGSGRLFL